MRFSLFQASSVAIFWLTSGCGPKPGPVVPTPAAFSEHVVSGRVLYEARRETPTGTSQVREPRPARFVTVRFSDPEGRQLAIGATDAEGRFQLNVPTVATRVFFESRIQHDGHDLMVTTDRGGSEPYRFERKPSANADTAILLRDDEEGAPAGAFHILDVALQGAEAVRAWTGRTLPPFSAYWGRGVTTSWSYYHGACPRDPLRYCVELLGGEPGLQATSDTDEHDEAIILHEFGHFVMDRLSTNSSHGGNHSGEILIDPGLAWEEGRASWFAMSVLGHPRYQDTIGMEGSGSLRVDYDFERGRLRGLRGLGSEQGAAELLWDLTDGAAGIADYDNDGVALGPAVVLQAMIDLTALPGAFVGVDTFLWFLVERELVTEHELETVLRRGGHPRELLVASQDERWPRTLPVPGSVSDKIDGHTDPAPSGGPARPQNGVDALRHYVVRVSQPARLTATLRIHGSGRAEDREDLDLELRDIRASLIDASRGYTSRESVSRMLEPGYYVLYVRDGGSGNRAGFDLSVRLD